jgi:predicted chitinase
MIKSMARINLSQFRNFFKFYDGSPHQRYAICLLYDDLPNELKDEETDWIRAYRSELKQKKAAKKWPITKEQMGAIMNCSHEQLPNELMEDFATCCRLYKLDRVNIAYFLGQCAHESAGLRYPLEIHDGSNYEFRSDLGNNEPGDGVKFAGTGYIQVTGKYWHTRFSDFLTASGEPDANILKVGKTHTCNRYPWSISGFWWMENDMIEYCKAHPPIDKVGALVNGRYLPNGYEDRRYYSQRAFETLGLEYPGN